MTDGDYLFARLVVGDPAALTNGDEDVHNWLTGEGWGVDLVDDGASAVLGAGTDLVVIAPSTSGQTLGSSYKQTGTPIVIFASSAWDDMALSETIGLFDDSTSLAWIDSAHPIATSATSPVQVVPTPRDMRSMSVSDLPTGADSIAARAEDTGEHVVFAMDAGATLADDSLAAERRAIVGFSDGALANLTADGQQIVVNAIMWAAESAAAFSTTGMTAPCGSISSVAACWQMNDTSDQLVDDSSPGSSPNWGSALTTTGGVTRKAVNGVFKRYFFTGWKKKVDADATWILDESLAAPIPQYFGQVLAEPTSGDSFDPGTGDFRIKLRVKAYGQPVGGSRQLPVPEPPSPNTVLDQPSYNVVQKGRANTGANGGYWKVSIMGWNGNNFDIGSVQCLFGDDDGTLVEAYTTNDEFLFDQDADFAGFHEIDCKRSGSTVSLSVDGSDPVFGTTPTDKQGTTAGLQNVVPSGTHGGKVAIGKKPSDDNAGDAFAGWIDWLVLAHSA